MFIQLRKKILSSQNQIVPSKLYSLGLHSTHQNKKLSYSLNVKRKNVKSSCMNKGSMYTALQKKNESHLNTCFNSVFSSHDNIKR